MKLIWLKLPGLLEMFYKQQQHKGLPNSPVLKYIRVPSVLCACAHMAPFCPIPACAKSCSRQAQFPPCTPCASSGGLHTSLEEPGPPVPVATAPPHGWTPPGLCTLDERTCRSWAWAPCGLSPPVPAVPAPAHHPWQQSRVTPQGWAGDPCHGVVMGLAGPRLRGGGLGGAPTCLLTSTNNHRADFVTEWTEFPKTSRASLQSTNRLSRMNFFSHFWIVSLILNLFIASQEQLHYHFSFTYNFFIKLFLLNAQTTFYRITKKNPKKIIKSFD